MKLKKLLCTNGALALCLTTSIYAGLEDDLSVAMKKSMALTSHEFQEYEIVRPNSVSAMPHPFIKIKNFDENAAINEHANLTLLIQSPKYMTTGLHQLYAEVKIDGHVQNISISKKNYMLLPGEKRKVNIKFRVPNKINWHEVVINVREKKESLVSPDDEQIFSEKISINVQLPEEIEPQIDSDSSGYSDIGDSSDSEAQVQERSLILSRPARTTAVAAKLEDSKMVVSIPKGKYECTGESGLPEILISEIPRTEKEKERLALPEINGILARQSVSRAVRGREGQIQIPILPGVYTNKGPSGYPEIAVRCESLSSKNIVKGKEVLGIGGTGESYTAEEKKKLSLKEVEKEIKPTKITVGAGKLSFQIPEGAYLDKNSPTLGVYDSNFRAQNIPRGVSIFGLSGQGPSLYQSLNINIQDNLQFNDNGGKPNPTFLFSIPKNTYRVSFHSDHTGDNSRITFHSGFNVEVNYLERVYSSSGYYPSGNNGTVENLNTYLLLKGNFSSDIYLPFYKFSYSSDNGGHYHQSLVQFEIDLKNRIYHSSFEANSSHYLCNYKKDSMDLNPEDEYQVYLNYERAYFSGRASSLSLRYALKGRAYLI